MGAFLFVGFRWSWWLAVALLVGGLLLTAVVQILREASPGDRREAAVGLCILLLLPAGLGALVFVGARWAWWLAGALLAGALVLLMTVSLARDRRAAKKQALPPHHALADVGSWLYRDDVNLLLADMDEDERVIVAVSASRRTPHSTGILALTDTRLRYCAGRVVGPTTRLSIPRTDIEGAALDDRLRFANLRLLVRGSEIRFYDVTQTRRAWELVGHLLADMDDPPSPGLDESVSVAAGEKQASSVDAFDLDVRLTPSAQRHAHRHGGAVYVWGEPFGAFQRVRVSTTRPTAITFPTAHSIDGIVVNLSEDAVHPGQLLVRHRPWWPRTPLSADTGAGDGG